jgi:exosortase E/protease (VPEID-CTERM system)
MVVLWRTPDRKTIGELAAASAPDSPRWGWLMSHLLCAAIFFPLSHRVLALPLLGSSHPTALLAAWTICMLLLVATAAAWAFPASALRPVARISGRPFLAGLLIGLAAWGAGFAALDLWPWLARLTLNVSAAAMRPIWGERLFVEPAERALGLGDFIAEIGDSCSGAEGMGLMAVLATAYLIKFRHALALPRALVLVPLAMGLSFLANIVRIILLIWVGDAVSPQVAWSGFHSKAGWVLTCAIAIGVLAWVRGSRWLAREPASRPHEPTDNPTALHLAPLLTGSALALLTGLFSTGLDRLFALRVLGTAIALLAVRQVFAGAAGRPRVVGVPVAVGVLVFAGWLLIARKADPEAVAAMATALAGLGPLERALWLTARVLGAVVVVPLAEELAFRGFLLRRLVSDAFWEFDLAVAARRPRAVLLSSVVFGLLHGAFIAGTLAGIAYALVLRRRGRLADAVVAHAVTNALLVVYTLVTGDWSFMA